MAAYIERAVQSRRDFHAIEQGESVYDDSETPEQSLNSRQRVEVMQAVLGTISKRDREVLARFYLLEQTQEQICEEMSLSETQFRLLKSRAKARFGELGKRQLARRPLQKLCLRKATSRTH